MAATSAAAISRAALLALAAALVLAAPARAQSLDEIASTLKSDHVYVDGSAVDAGALKAKIGDAPTFVAVVPADAIEGSAGRTLIALREKTGVKGSYALLAGSELRTLSDEFGGAGRVGDTLRAKYGTDTQATLEAFVGRAAKERTHSGGGAGGLIAVGILALAVVAAVSLITARRRRRNDGHSTVGQINQTDDFVRLGDAIRALELDVTLGQAGRADYDRAVAAYERANELQRRGDEAGANRALDDGLAAIAAARERIAGRE